MCEVLIVQSRHTCRVVCECGYEAMVVVAPETCPDCGGPWDKPRFEEAPYN